MYNSSVAGAPQLCGRIFSQESAMNKSIGCLLLLGAVAVFEPACSTAPKSEAKREELSNKVDDAIADFKAADPDIQRFFDTARGFAVFPTIGKGAAGVGGAYGKGQVFENGIMTGYCDMTQATIGLALGGQSYSEIIFFENQAALDRFKSGNFAFAAQASAVALKSGVATNAKYSDGVAVFTLPRAGLMGEASVGGQKFTFRPV
jgi:lipid-binding SYLF domain-containing protein